MSEASSMAPMVSVDSVSAVTAQETAQRPLSTWSKCTTIGLVDGKSAVVPLSETYIEWLDHHFPDGP